MLVEVVLCAYFSRLAAGQFEYTLEQVTENVQSFSYYDEMQGQDMDIEQTTVDYNGNHMPEQMPPIDNNEPMPTNMEQTPYEVPMMEHVTDFPQTPNAHNGDNTDQTTHDYSDGQPMPGYDQTPTIYGGDSVPEASKNEQTPNAAPEQVTGFDQVPNGYNALDSRPGFPIAPPPGFPTVVRPPFPPLGRPPVLTVARPPIIPPPFIPPIGIPPPYIVTPTLPPIPIPTPPPTAAPLPPGYVCVPAGTCPASNGIDIRIVTPGSQSACPPGQVPCAATGGLSQCGTRSATNVNTADGPTTQGAYPWQVYLVNQTGYAGSGALLDQYHVLTAAHKVYMNGGTPNMISVYLGVYNPLQLGVSYSVVRVFVHPNFNPSNLFNDLALLRLTTPVSPLPQQFVNTVCLPTQGQSFVGQTCWVSGWGQTAFNVNNAPTTQQRQVQVPIVSYSTCYASMSNVNVLGSNVNTYLDPVGELCAGGQGSRDACTQDGGSPLVCNVNGRFTVAGLVIWGKGCGRQGVYGVYVNVANYINWITSSITMLNG